MAEYSAVAPKLVPRKLKEIKIIPRLFFNLKNIQKNPNYFLFCRGGPRLTGKALSAERFSVKTTINYETT